MGHPRSLRRSTALVLAAALALSACGPEGGDRDEIAAGEETATEEAAGEEAAADEPAIDEPAPTSTTTSVPPGGRQPTAEDPLRLLFAGDSIGFEVAAPAMAALGGGGSAVTYFVANPSLTRDESGNGLWEIRLQESDPEVVVLLVGVWERMVFGRDRETGQTVDGYRRNVIDPFVDLVTANGAEIVWVTSPIVAESTAADQISFLNEAFRSLAESDDRVQYVDADDFVAGQNGEFADVLPGLDGVPERVRRLDGTHLCPGGAVRMAAPLIDLLAERWNLPVADDWQNGAWRAATPFEAAPVECPAVS